VNPLHRQLAELFSRYVRAVDGVERNLLGAQLDALAPLVLTHPTKEQQDVVPESNEDPGQAAVHL
jgi:hypothetical protein